MPTGLSRRPENSLIIYGNLERKMRIRKCDNYLATARYNEPSLALNIIRETKNT